MFKNMRFTISRKIVIATVALVLMGVIQGTVAYVMSSGSSYLAKELSEDVTPVIGDFADFREVYFSVIAQMDAYKKSFSDIGREAEVKAIEAAMANNVKYADLVRGRVEQNREFFSEPAAIIDVANPKFENYFLQNAAVIADHSNVLQSRVEYQEVFGKLSDELNNLFLSMYDALESERLLEDPDMRFRITEVLRLGDIANYNAFLANNKYSTLLTTRDMAIKDEIEQHFVEATNALNEILGATHSDNVMNRATAAMGYLDGLKASFANGMSYFDIYNKTVENQVTIQNDLTADMDDLAESFSEISTNIGNETYTALTTTINAAILMTVATISLGVFIIFMLIRSVVAPLNRFTAMTKELTEGDGDLTQRIVTANNDELKDLAEYFNAFIASVQQVVTEVKYAADEVVSGNNELASTMEELAVTFESQTHQVNEIVTSMGSINHNATVANDAFKKNLDILSQTTASTKEGQLQLSEVQVKMTMISEQADSLSQTISRLATSSGDIGEILTTINDIADQTNLLALNAAIEAARAGEAGRGFAVVADEVRKLAERTQKATSEIETIVSSLQVGSQDASKEMQKSGEFVTEGVESIQITSAGFNEVVETVITIFNDTEELSAQNTEQFNTIQTVSDNTQTIASGIEQSNAAVSQVVTTVNHLQTRTENLKELVGVFKV